MSTITLQLDRDDAGYVPGEPITGRVSWDLDANTDRVFVRLVWQTSGKGNRDVGVVDEQIVDRSTMRGEREFAFEGVEGPYSFSGRLITLSWTVEAEASDAYTELPLTVSPSGEEVLL